METWWAPLSEIFQSYQVHSHFLLGSFRVCKNSLTFSVVFFLFTVSSIYVHCVFTFFLSSIKHPLSNLLTQHKFDLVEIFSLRNLLGIRMFYRFPPSPWMVQLEEIWSCLLDYLKDIVTQKVFLLLQEFSACIIIMSKY